MAKVEFYTPDATNLFREIDSRARSDKHRFQLYGFSVVTLALIALTLAVVEPLFVLPAAKNGAIPAVIPSAFAIVAAMAGISSVAIGWSGMGIAGRKRQWLKHRLICESIRLWHFQYICSHIPDIVDAGNVDGGVIKYCRQRDHAFAEFKSSFVDNIGAHLSAQLDPDLTAGADNWCVPGLGNIRNAHDGQASTPDRIAEELFCAYDIIRFQRQLDFSSYMLGTGSFFSHPKVQRGVLESLGYGAIILTVVLHTLVIVGVLAGIPALKGAIVHAGAVLAALLALAGRVLEDGLQPSEHLSRLRSYFSEICTARRRFQLAKMTEDKKNSICDFEHAAARELTGFIQIVSSARFLL